MYNKNQSFDHYKWLSSLISKPPALPEKYTKADYSKFMRDETYLYSPRYANKYVSIHGQDRLIEIAAQGSALLTPLHYGSFFLSGGAIVQQLNLSYTAIVTGRNITCLPEEEQLFWKGVHQRSSDLYKRPLFYTGSTPPRNLLAYLDKPGNFLGAVLDVREQGQFPNEYPFDFLGTQIYLPTGPARLAYLANVPIVPMTIQYNQSEQRHHLYFGEPILPCKDHVEVTQQLLSYLEYYIAAQPLQCFYDMVSTLSLPHKINN